MINPTVQVALIAATPPTIVALGGVILGFINKMSIREIHVSMNSRFDEFITAARAASFAEGQKSERDKNESPR